MGHGRAVGFNSASGSVTLVVMDVISLQSGSSGNCIFVRSGGTSLLFDAGISARQAETRLGQFGHSIRECQGIVLSHEHTDHICGVGPMHRKFGLPVYANRPTLAATLAKGATGRIDRWHHFTSGRPFQIGPLSIEPLSTPHDASDSVCFVIEETTTGKRFGLFTDLGHVFDELREVIGTLDAVLIESNYDDDMLWDGPYPYRLKERIAGSAGHISNREAAALLDGCDASRLQWACLGHLSGENNSPEVAMATHRHRHRDRFQLFCADRGGATPLPEIRRREAPLRSYLMS